ncbi:MAG TPA: RHS repeat-associated core domain-containing protein, partial [Terriglobales bacterium]|nr:RHS repeat-associated core domain-containing protein [Terriglobales bacterium]
RLYWYGAPGIVAESDLSGNLTAEYVFFDGERVARRDLPSGTVHYYFSDHLKSVSVVTSASGIIEEESDYRPWGEEKVITHTLSDQHFKFNGKERDSETGFDEFGARLYSSAWSRWLTPDWSADPTPVPYANMDNPQSLNLYEYALNNPTTLPDLDGHLTPMGSCCGGGQQPSDASFDEMLRELDEARLAERTQGAATEQPSAQQQKKEQQLSEQGLKFIECHEAAACKPDLKPYDASGNKHLGDWTIGYGHKIRPGEDFSKGITKEQAAALLAGDVRAAVDVVNHSLKHATRTQAQFDAMVSLAYNIGGSPKRGFPSSTLIREFNSGGRILENYFTRWDRTGGAVSQGLLNRRKDEWTLFNTGQY